jgi:hypothetical protein
VIFFVPSVELKNQATGRGYPIVDVAVAMFGQRVCPKKFGVPATARSYIPYGDEGLGLDVWFTYSGTHGSLLL